MFIKHLQGPRAQIDRKLYKKFIQNEMSHTKNLMCLEASVDDILIDHHPPLGAFCQGVLLGGIFLLLIHTLSHVNFASEDGQKIFSKAVIITTGTFLKAQILLGQESWSAGRINCHSSVPLAASFERLGVRLNRLKTGTPPRLLRLVHIYLKFSKSIIESSFRKSIDFSKLTVSQPDNPPSPFSYLNKRVAIEVSSSYELSSFVASNITKTALRSTQLLPDSHHSFCTQPPYH